MTKILRCIRVRIPRATEFIGIARRAVDALGEEMQLSAEDRAAVQLAVGEACDNAVRHAKGAVESPDTVLVVCRIDPEAVQIEVSNHGNGFHPETPACMPEALAEDGRGRALMELLMDSVEYLSEQGDTVVRMRKRRTASSHQKGAGQSEAPARTKGGTCA